MRANTLTPTLTPICLAFAAILSTTAVAATSGMYRWVDAEGSVNYSNQAPPETAREVTLIDDATSVISSSEKRTREILEVERQGHAPREATAPPTATIEIVPTPVAGSDSGPVRAAVLPIQPEAVRDPCLRSADPKCYERNRAAYVPYRGYAPGSAAVVSVGATASAAGGTLGGSSPASTKLTPPKSSDYAVPPGTEAAPLPPLRRTKR